MNIMDAPSGTTYLPVLCHFYHVEIDASLHLDFGIEVNAFGHIVLQLKNRKHSDIVRIVYHSIRTHCSARTESTESDGTALEPNSEYTVVVYAYFSDLIAPTQSTQQTIHTLPGVPTNVALQVAAGAASTSLTVSWTEPTNGAVSYAVQLSDGTTTTQYTATSSPYTISNLTPDTTYTATVTAANGNGNGAASSESAGVRTAECNPDTDADCNGFSTFQPHKSFLLLLALLVSILITRVF